jgi:hypothetical protein
MIRERSDCSFIIPTKRIERMEKCLPSDWGDGYENVTICCTVENQKRADQRLPVFLALPIKHRQIYCEPLLEKIDIEKYLDDRIEVVAAGGREYADALLTCIIETFEDPAVVYVTPGAYPSQAQETYETVITEETTDAA